MSSSNPFAQSPHYWRVNFCLPQAAAEMAEESFSDLVISVSAFETDEENHIWTFDLLCGAPPELEEFRRRLIIITSMHHIPLPELSVVMVEPQDWLAQVARDFPPMRIGRFYVHGAHVKEKPPYASLPIQVEAGAAFGSGEHGTTRGCLEALEWLSQKRRFTNILDMGCGSGILAIGAARLWRAPVLAVDIDEVAVRVSAENALINRVSSRVRALVSDGYDGAEVQSRGPYDLIVSNILAKPLMAFAPKLKANLAHNGMAVLSGLLTHQENMVMAAHRRQGLHLKKRFVHGEWCALVIG
ncbi:MAG: 50S ribosomal protein L11 methyltransferase [Rickettsiales bacterium]|jgi:ribosomal protein L11 methyltransferase|nr:50S ribosomal protein L11 methyltransferase [Rickettsiales bacterium]